jgi:RNA polymerase sigma-70 factor (ECF subfamily)
LDPLEAEIDEVARGNSAAFRRIVERTQHRLVRLAVRILGDQAEAEDAVQESYVKAHDALARGRFDRRSSMETWLYRIVTRTAIDAARRGARTQRLPETLEREPGGADIENRLALRELSTWLLELPRDQHAALLLKAVEGFSSAEVAAILECSEGAVEQRLVRARVALRQRSAGSGPAASSELFAWLGQGGERALA